jgi:uncharacterized phiE125 gp8 family phage protein
MSALHTDLSLVSAPEHEPLTVETAKTHLRFASAFEDTLIEGWIASARLYFEEQTGRQVIPATWSYWLERFPCQREIELPKPPLIDVTAVTYLDADGARQTFDAANYTVVTPRGPYSHRGRLVLAPSATWPYALCQAGSVQIEFRAGYVDPTISPEAIEVPKLVVSIVLFLIGHFHRFRSEVQDLERSQTIAQLPIGAQTMLRGFVSYSTLEPTD